MKLGTLFLLATLMGFLCTSMVRAQEEHQHHHDSSEKLGQVNFLVSCSAEAQKQFNRAVALLHSFEYEDAEKAFSATAITDPSCAMCYWGIAMSIYHQIWLPPPDSTILKKGQEAILRAKSIGAKTEREKDYIAAIETYYKDSDKLDHRTRSLAYEKAMEQVYLRYPKDHEAAVFYALSLLGTALPTDRSYANQKKAAEILNKVLLEEPQHPGVSHYIIHSLDYPSLATLALPAARSYAKIAPSAPHALHMPSHIFTQLGLWQESIQSNVASAAAAKTRAAKDHPGVASFEQLHAMEYLLYAYLQEAQDQDAKAVLDEITTITKVDYEGIGAASAFASIPARYAVEMHNWSEAAGLELHPTSFPWERFEHTAAIIYFAKALGAARSGDAVTARKNVERLISIYNGLVEAKESYWASQVEIKRQIASAWLARAEGKNDEALKLMRRAADLDDSTDRALASPPRVIPARELLGEMLMELNQPEQALGEFEKSLQDSPNRFNGLYGAARAAELSGDLKKARTYYEKLVALCDHANGTRPELLKATAFLAKK